METTMKRDIRLIPLDLIKLDQENVRFGGDVAQNQREAIDLMMADPEDAQKILRLAEHIATYGLDPTELQLIMPDSDGGYTVLEGNRRLTALKLLQKPDLCPDEKLVKKFISAHHSVRNRLPAEIECSVVPNRDAGDMWIELKHTGQNGGVGRVNWDSDIRDERRARQTGVDSIGRQIRNLIKDNLHIFSPNTVSDVFTIPVTTLTRLFSSRPAQDAFQIKVESKELIPLYDLKFIAPSLEFAINLFRHEGYNVNDIRSDDDRRRFISHIPPELDPEKLANPPKNNQNAGNTTENVDTKGNNGSTLPNSTSSTNGAENNGENSQQEGQNKPRPKPSSKSRKYLFPWALNINNNRINAIYRELRSGLKVEEFPNATSITFRVFIEVSCDDYIYKQKKQGDIVVRDDNKKEVTDDDKLSIKIIAVTKHLEQNNLLTKHESRTICRRAGNRESIGSVDHLNQFVHSSASAPIPSELKDVAEEYRPMLSAIWQ